MKTKKTKNKTENKKNRKRKKLKTKKTKNKTENKKNRKQEKRKHRKAETEIPTPEKPGCRCKLVVGFLFSKQLAWVRFSPPTLSLNGGSLVCGRRPHLVLIRLVTILPFVNQLKP